MIPCGQCSRPIPSPHQSGLYREGDIPTCVCGAVNRIVVDDLVEPPVAYVYEWTCKHGIDGDVTCEECDGQGLTGDVSTTTGNGR